MVRRNRNVGPSPVDFGGWAEHYVSRPYGNFKFEVYPLFVDILAAMPDGIRVLDIGAGPGHLAFEFFKAHPRSATQFVLLDSSVELLGIAESRLAPHAEKIRTRHGAFDQADWDAGLGKFDAIVSNNVPFPVESRALLKLYKTCFARLKKSGVFLFQEPCSYSGETNPYSGNPLSDFLAALPAHLLPSLPTMSAREKKKLHVEKREALARHKEAIAEARAAGVQFPARTDWRFVTVATHIRALEKAGFCAGCIWKKRGSAVLLGVKGRPRMRTTP